MSDQPNPTPDAEPKTPETLPADDAPNVLRSPVRPVYPEPNAPAPREPNPAIFAAATPADNANDPATNPTAALNVLRQKMEVVASEFAQGKINRAQFNALYGRYSEQRAIIQRLLERNPDSKAWRQVMGAGGQTGFLRQHFEAQPMYYLVFYHDETAPVMVGGKHSPLMEQIKPVLKTLWSMANRPKVGLARKAMGEGHWLVLAVGEHCVTLVMFMLEPSITQTNLVRDLHADFERANLGALERKVTAPERLVFPQRALVEQNF